MDMTPNLHLPYILAAQAQKHVTHNEAIRALDALVQLTVLDRDLTGPPASPADGARYIVAAGATGAWSGQSLRVAAFQDGAWSFFTPLEGWIAWVADEDAAVVWSGTAWVPLGTGGAASVNPTPLVGVNATADATNRLSVNSPATLLNHEGTGHQLKVNKAAAAHTASLLYQDGFSGRAEMGLTGDDDFHVKVSADGATWKEALIVNRTTGTVAMPFTSGSVVKQLVAAAFTATVTITSAADTATGLAAVITPQAAANKVLVRVTAVVGGDFWFVAPKGSIYRSIGGGAATKIWPTGSGIYNQHQMLADNAANSGYISYNAVLEIDDAPATTSAVTYEFRLASDGTRNAYVNWRHVGGQRGES